MAVRSDYALNERVADVSAHLHGRREVPPDRGGVPLMAELEDLEADPLFSLPAVETIASAGPVLEDMVLGNPHGSAWPSSARDRAALAAWRGSVAQLREMLETLGEAVDSLDAELERIAGRA
jgi:hypothetical protein